MTRTPLADADSPDRAASPTAASRRSFLATAAGVGAAGFLSRSSAAARESAAATALETVAETAAGASGPSEHRVVSYYTGWSRYDRDYYPEDVPLDSISDLNYAFLTVEEDGTVTYADAWGDQENLEAFRELQADHPETDYYLSIGGWSDSQYFSNAAAAPANRERFASTAIEIMREYEFDGLDLDWEYPGGGGHEQNVTREDDPQNFVLLLEELRSQLDAAEAEDDATYAITMAASANPTTASALPIEEIEPYVEYVTVMTYDYAGGWSDVTGHNAPLYGDGPSVAESMAWWAEQPIPREKLLLGVPFYGRTFTGVETTSDGTSNGSDEPAVADGLGASFDGDDLVLYRDVDDDYPTLEQYERYWDDEAAVPYRYSPDAETFVSYDDAESIARKAEFAVDEGFGGVMCWEQPGDPDAELLAVVEEALESGTDSGPCEAAGAADAAEVDGQPVCDLDGDGEYMDVNGDGAVSNGDVVEFFSNQHAPAWDERTELFDFDGDGSVGQSDVVALFEHVVER